jgi:hypothetical protein
MLINNAAINLGDENLRQVTGSALLQTLEVNAVGPVLVAQGFLDMLKAGPAPKLINISSEAGSITRMGHFRGYGYYGSKRPEYVALPGFGPELTEVIGRHSSRLGARHGRQCRYTIIYHLAQPSCRLLTG